MKDIIILIAVSIGCVLIVIVAYEIIPPSCDGTNCERPVAIYHCDGDCEYAILLGEILADFALSIQNTPDTCMKIDTIDTGIRCAVYGHNDSNCNYGFRYDTTYVLCEGE